MLTPPLLITQPIPMGLLSSGMLILIWTLREREFDVARRNYDSLHLPNQFFYRSE